MPGFQSGADERGEPVCFFVSRLSTRALRAEYAMRVLVHYIVAVERAECSS